MTFVHVGAAAIYHEVHGAGDPVLLLHGGFCSLEALGPQLDSLASAFQVHAPERPGHGRSPDVDGPITYPGSVADVIGYMDEVGLENPHIVGFSDGAIIGLLIALEHPDRCRSVVSISGNLHPSGFVDDVGEDPPESTDTPADPDPYREQYDALSPDGPDHADVVLAKLMHLWTNEPDIDTADLARIRVPVLVMAGDHDVIRLEHSSAMASAIPAGQLCIVPAAGHGLMHERPTLVNAVTHEFLTSIAGRSTV